MGDRRKQLTRDHKKILPEVEEATIVASVQDMGRAKSDLPGTSRDTKDVRKKKSTKERWLLTRKTWRYMADAGRKLIPDGAHNRPEDIPKIESYFQHVCRKEPRFLLWRKSSYPGALGFRSNTRRNRNRKKGGSYREKASSADEAEELMFNTLSKDGGQSRDIPTTGGMVMTPTTSGRFDVHRLRQEFLQGPSTSITSTTSSLIEGQEKPERPKSFLQKLTRIHPTKSASTKSSPVLEKHSPGSEFPPQQMQGSLYMERTQSSMRQDPESPESIDELEELDQKEFIDTLTRYLSQEEDVDDDDLTYKTSRKEKLEHEPRKDIDFQLLLDQLRKNLATEYSSQRHHVRESSERLHQGGTISTRSNISPSVHFEGDHQQKMMLETLNRYFGKTTNREKMISDLLTDRKLLEKLYSDLRRTRGSRGRSTNSGSSNFPSQLRLSSVTRRRDCGDREIKETDEPSSWTRFQGKSTRGYREGYLSPPPLIEVQHEIEPVFADHGTQTDPIPASMMIAIEEELRKARDKAREENEGMMSPGGTNRRRSSVDHDDVSPSVSDTIKRYLRMARKKSLDSDKVDRFKRVNYDRNLRNIKPKGEITKPGDDDGLNKGSQSDESWIDAMKELKLDDILESTDMEAACANEELFASHVTSSRSSVDIDDGLLSPASPPYPKDKEKGLLSSGQSFLSSLLHGLQHHQATQGGGVGTGGGTAGAGGGKDGTVTTIPCAAGSMQKSKSSSSVVQHGRNLVSKKIWKSRSKSQVRGATTPIATSVWTPQGHCMWSNVAGRQIVLTDTSLLELTELERKVLQKVSVAKLHTLNLGINVKIPSESVGAVSQKPKRRAYLLKRKALTTGFFDSARGKETADKDKCSGGFVFGIPISQCLENDRLNRSSRNQSPLRGRAASDDDQSADLRRQSHHGSRSSFTSLIDTTRAEESGSCESLMGSPSTERMTGSVAGLLDTLSCSTLDISCSEREASIPQIVLLCIRHLENYGLHTLGLFRISSSKKKVRQLREEIDCGKEFVMNEDTCPHVVATLLKEFFRDLPDPLLCRDLYQAFVQTQRIRNRRLQHEAMQHLIQLLPVPNRDTLSALVNFLSVVAHHSRDSRGPTGEWIYGNKMDSNNLATLIAPNILHCIKPGCGQELSTEGAEERIDVINVVRSMIDHNHDLFTVTAEVLDEVYVHMMDSHPDVLDVLLRKRYYSGEDLDDPECTMEGGVSNESPCQSPSSTTIDQDASGDQELPASEPVRRVWSREDFLHESAGMGGPDLAMRPRHKDRDRGRERTSKKRSPVTSTSLPSQDVMTNLITDDNLKHSNNATITTGYTTMHLRTTTTRHMGGGDEETSQKIRSVSVDSGNVTSSEELTGKLYTAMDDHERRQSSPGVSDTSSIITASLKIPVPGAATGAATGTAANSTQSYALNLDDTDIPFIEDNTGYVTTEGGIQQMTIGLVRGTSTMSGSAMSGSAMSGSAVSVTRSRRHRSASGSDTSSQASTVLPVTGSIALVQGQSYDSAMGSSATYSSPLRNTTPSVCSSSGGEAGLFSSTPSWASTPPTSPDATVTTVNYIPEDTMQQSARFSIPTKVGSGEDISGNMQTARFSIPTKGSMSYQRGISVTTKELAPVMLQKVTFTSTSELQQLQKGDATSSYATYQKTYSPGSSGELPKSASTSAVLVNKKVEFEPERDVDRKLTTSISSIGGAVMRSKTADIERMLKLQKDAGKPKAVGADESASQDDKKKYAKRRYTDSRHQTRHIPDVEALQSTQTASAAKSTNIDVSEPGDSVLKPSRSRSGPIWKRRELIASDPKEHETFL